MERGPLKDAEIVYLLQSGVSPARLRALVRRHGIEFKPTPEILELIGKTGGDAALLEALRAASPARPPVPPPSSAPSHPGAPSPYEAQMALIRGGPRGDFYLSRFEVTNREYLGFCQRSGRPRPAPPFWIMAGDYPVVNVTWHDAVTFCRWLSLETSKRHRLPTEAEWEYAARGGRLGQAYPWGDKPPTGRSCFGRGAPCPVGTYKPNAFGLHDMVGSVAEWCEDDYGSGGKGKVVRGGGWASPAESPELLSLAQRDRLDPDKTRNDVGFRVARDP